MKMLRFNRILKGSLIVYGILYALMILDSLLGSSEPSALNASPLELGTVVFCFVLFVIGTVICWFNGKVGGIVLMVYHFIVWFFAMTIWEQAGMVLVLIFPVLVVAALFIRNWYINQEEKYRVDKLATQLTLDVLLINYTAIYFFLVAIEVLQSFSIINLSTRSEYSAQMDYGSTTGILLLMALLTFVAGLIIVTKKRLYSGILFVVWYLIVLFLSYTSSEFFNSGPWSFFGITVLVNGIFYIKDNIKSGNTQELTI